MLHTGCGFDNCSTHTDVGKHARSNIQTARQTNRRHATDARTNVPHGDSITGLASVTAADKTQAVSLLLLSPGGALYGHCRHCGSNPLVQHCHRVLLIGLPHHHVAGSALNSRAMLMVDMCGGPASPVP